MEQQQQQQGDPIRTLFLSGLPNDVMPREVYNLCRFFDGFQHCSLNAGGMVPTAFLAFASEGEAEEAKERLHDLAFDERFPDNTLRVEWAKKNSMAKKEPRAHVNGGGVGGGGGGGANGYSQRKRPRVGGGGDGGDGGGITTLFVANLGANAIEQEIQQLFYTQPGVVTFKFSGNRNRGSVAFVDFVTSQQAADCLRALSGASVSSSSCGGLRIEFAKKSMEKSKAPGGAPMMGGAPPDAHAMAAHQHHAALAMSNPYAATMGYGAPPPAFHQAPPQHQGMGYGGYGGGYPPQRQ